MLLCYLAHNGKKSTTEISQKWDFYEKKILVTFYCCFFRFFFKNCQKVKVTNLTKNCQNYQNFLETCFLRSLDTIWQIFHHSIIFMSFCDMENRGHKIEIWGKKKFFNHTFYCWKIWEITVVDFFPFWAK